jgi:PKD repeat protein
MSKRILFLTIFSAFLLIPFISKAAVVINEVAWMGTSVEGIDPGSWWRYEWLELYNNGAPISLDGWTIELYRDNLDFTIPLTGTISDYFLIVSSDKIPNYDFNYSNLAGKFNNNGQRIVLKDNQGNIVEDLNYFASGWPAGDNTIKQTMERISTGWQTSLNSGGTPKAQNSSGAVEESESTTENPATPTIPTNNRPPIADAGNDVVAFIGDEITFDGSKSYDPDGFDLAYEWNLGEGGVENDVAVTHKYSYPGTYLVTLTVFDGKYYVSDTITVEIYPKKITINEFLPSPIGKDEEEEWIELYNDSDQIIDLSGWQLDDEDGGSKPFVFPKNTLIAPNGYLVFPRTTTKIALNNDKDRVRLLLSSGTVFQEISYEKAPQGKSSARTSEGFFWAMPTPGFANIVGPENQEITSEKPLQSETTVYASQNIALTSQNNLKNSISGGWVYLNPQENQSQNNNQLAYNLAAIQRPSGASNKTILIILTIIILAVASILLLLKLKKKI